MNTRTIAQGLSAASAALWSARALTHNEAYPWLPMISRGAFLLALAIGFIILAAGLHWRQGHIAAIGYVTLALGGLGASAQTADALSFGAAFALIASAELAYTSTKKPDTRISHYRAAVPITLLALTVGLAAVTAPAVLRSMAPAVVERSLDVRSVYVPIILALILVAIVLLVSLARNRWLSRARSEAS